MKIMNTSIIEERPQSDARLLVVEDEPNILELLSASLRYAGFEVITAAGGTEAVQAAKGGQVEFRADKAGIVHAGVGKASFTEAALVDNVRAFVGAITRAKPTGVKGTYIERVNLSSTMGPGVKVDLSGLAAE